MKAIINETEFAQRLTIAKGEYELLRNQRRATTERTSQQLSQELLAGKPLDPWVFGPEYRENG